MCQATIYRELKGAREEILHDVISMEHSGNNWSVKVLLEEPMEIQGRIVKIDFLKHTVTLRQEEQ